MAQLSLTVIVGDNLGNSNSVSFSAQGGTIGRSDSCNLSLSDNNRFISNVHAQVDFQDNAFWLTDVSTNGLFINSTSNALGKSNRHSFVLNDVIFIGQYQLKVTALDLLDNAPVENNECADSLLNLVMGGESSPAAVPETHDPLAALSSSAKPDTPADESSLGLSELISNPATTPAASPAEDPFGVAHAQAPEINQPQANSAPASPASATNIPDDWELSGIMPAIKEFDIDALKSNAAKTVDNTTDDAVEQTSSGSALPPEFDLLNAAVKSEQPFVPDVPELEAELAIPPTVDVIPVAASPVAAVMPAEAEVVIPAPQVEPAIPSAPAPMQAEYVSPAANVVDPLVKGGESVNKPDIVNQSMAEPQPSNDAFFDVLYERLGLPKEYVASVDKAVFADDLAAILLSTTQGLMSLLNGRSIFKQESRLSVTSVQPRSNNPLKFSIDPVDCLEALLLKKKAGYVSTKAAYEEAVNDLQLHQMAFLTGLQATMSGVLGELDANKIEADVKENSRSFMGKVSTSHCWQNYKNKHVKLADAVEQNLNQMLGQYFADAYEAQITKIKNENKG